MYDVLFVVQFEKPFIEVTRSKSRCRLSNNSTSVRSSSHKVNQHPIRHFPNSSHCRHNRPFSPFQVFLLRSNHLPNVNGRRPIWWHPSLRTKHSRSRLSLDSPWVSHHCTSRRHLQHLDSRNSLEHPATLTRSQGSNQRLQALRRCLSKRLQEWPSRMVK